MVASDNDYVTHSDCARKEVLVSKKKVDLYSALRSEGNSVAGWGIGGSV